MTTRRASSTTGDGMHVSEAQLYAMTADLDARHQAVLPEMGRAVAEWAEQYRDRRVLRPEPRQSPRHGPSRRSFLAAAGAAVGGLALAGCSSTSSTSRPTGSTAPGGPLSTGSGVSLTGDLAAANLAAGLENLAVQAYQKAIDAVASNQLQGIPPAMVAFAMTAQKQHKDHSTAWNAVLTNAAKPAQRGVDLTVRDAYVTPMFPAVKDAVSLGAFALGLEKVAGATYLFSIQNTLTDLANLKIAATIQPVEMQHVAILNLVLGRDPVAESFTQTTGHASATDMIG